MPRPSTFGWLPMAGVTNAPFRLIARELRSRTADQRGARRARPSSKVIYEPSCSPATSPRSARWPSSSWAPIPTYWPRPPADWKRRGADAIDLNMGCPAPKIVAKGQGAALMRDPLQAALVMRSLRKAIQVPLTVKIRGGWDERSVNAPEIARIAESEGVDAITVHPRTRSQQYTGRAPWDVIAAIVVGAVGLPVTGNGDVRSHADALAMTRSTGCAAVMIGRGALGAPWVFRPVPADRDERANIIRRHCTLIDAHLPARDALVQLKKHLAWYSVGLPGSARLRPQLFTALRRGQRAGALLGGLVGQSERPRAATCHTSTIRGPRTTQTRS